MRAGETAGKVQIPTIDAEVGECGDLPATTNTSRQRQLLLGSVKDITSICKVERN